MSTTCKSHVRRAPAVVRSAEDALATLAIATRDARDTCVVVASLDASHRPQILLVIDGATSTDVGRAVDLLLAAAGPAEARAVVADMFVACSGRAAREPGEAECWLLREVDRRAERAEVRLLDWFMLFEGSAVSVAERAGWTPRW